MVFMLIMLMGVAWVIGAVGSTAIPLADHDSVSETPSQAESVCTISTGMPSCDFHHSHCSYTSYSEDGHSLDWVLSANSPIGHDWDPSGGGSGYYIYLDGSDSNAPAGTRALISSQLFSLMPTTICIDFHYATTGSDGQTVRVYLQGHHSFASRETDELIGELTDLDTGGQWKEANFFACVEDKAYIAFESEKTSENSTLALDYIRIRHTNTPCTSIASVNSSTSTVTATSSVTDRWSQGFAALDDI